MHSCPPHLSCVATLPENTLATEQACLFSCGWEALIRSRMMRPTDNQWLPVLLDISTTD